MRSSSPSSRHSRAQHHHLLGVDVRAREAERLDVELVELPVAALLRALVAEHRSGEPHALRPLVESGCARSPRARCRAVASGRSVRLSPDSLSSNVYISFSTTSVASPIAAHEQRRRLDDRHAHVAIAVLREHVAHRRPRSAPTARASSGSTSFMPRTACRFAAAGSPSAGRTRLRGVRRHGDSLRAGARARRCP